MTPKEYSRELTRLVDAAIAEIEAAMPRSQASVFDEIEAMLRGLTLRGRDVAMTAENIRTLTAINARLESVLVSNPRYSDAVSRFVAAFDAVTALQNRYFAAISPGFAPTAFAKALQADTVAATLASLGRGGIATNVSAPLGDMLRNGLRVGIDYWKMVDGVRDYIIGTPEIEGRMLRYTKQITTDALNQYASGYTQLVSADLGLDWFRYAGAEMVTSRTFCVGMVHKQFFHRLEIPSMLAGDFPEFVKAKGRIDPKTGLPQGMYPNTTPQTFTTYRGGYNCHHQAIAVTEGNVPIAIRLEAYARFNIRHDEKGFKLAA